MSDVYAASAPGEKLLIKFGDGAGPENFAHACSINTDRSIEFTTDSSSAQIPNCTDPSKPAITRRRVKALDSKITGSGIADMPSTAYLLAKQQAGEPVNMQVVQDVEDGGWTAEGPYIIDSIKPGGGARGEEQTFDISLSQADAVTVEFD
jgi:tail tube protein